ncbi:hypothetical protein PP713_08755 [Mycobacterium sp. CSUR Q5927]|nr:hypothetical protein [Mycobacterium sp. CSUR Q5927]
MRKPIIAAAAVAALSLGAGIAHADPADDPHMPNLAAGKCTNSPTAMGMVNRCLGEPYPDGTYWMETQWMTVLPVIGPAHQQNGVHCVIGDPNWSNAAPPGGCGGAA